MENIMILRKTKKEIIVDELLNKKEDFRIILEKTGWNMMDLINYIDSKFRIRYPEEYNNDIEYYCKGIAKPKQITYTYKRMY